MGEPAWKRLGLKVKAVVGKDPLAIVTQREEGEDKTERKEKKQGKRKAEDGARARPAKAAKAAKRVKLPRQERLQKQRQSAGEKDQLQYLRQFDEDREHWKFSKQKQNWLIKNIRQVPESYEASLLRYLESVQGGSRERIVEQMKAVVDTWNTMVDDAEEQMKRDLEETEEKDSDEHATNTKKTKTKTKKTKQEKPKKKAEQEKETPPDYDYAVRAREVHCVLSGEKLFLKSIDEEDEQQQQSPLEVEVDVAEEDVDVDESGDESGDESV